MKKFIIALVILVVMVTAAQPGRVQAVGEASTQFGIFVPPSPVVAQWSALIVTAIQDGTSVDIVDDSSDGDVDDTLFGVAMGIGQSYILYINEGGIKITVAGKEITVCCDDCVKQAQENPAKYAEASA